jgi:hypothetical protein
VLDTKRSRGVVIVAVVGAWLVVGAFVSQRGQHELDDRTHQLEVAARERFADVDPADIDDLTLDYFQAPYDGETSSTLADLLVLDGQEPTSVADQGSGFEARYPVDAWGRHATVVVLGGPDGIEVHTA